MKRRSQHTTRALRFRAPRAGKVSRKPLGGLTERERALRQVILREVPLAFRHLEKVGCDPDILLIHLVQWAWSPSLIASKGPALLKETRRIQKAVEGLRKATSSSRPSFLKSTVYEVLRRLDLDLRFDHINRLRLDQMNRLQPMKERDRRSAMSLLILYWVKRQTGKFHFGTVAQLLNVTATFFNRGNNRHIYPPTKQSLQVLLKRRRTSKQFPKGDDDPLKFGLRVV